MTNRELQRLHEVVAEAQAEKDRPWEPGEESRPVTFVTDHLSEEGWKLGWRLVGAYRDKHPELFRAYGERELHMESLDLLVEADRTPTIKRLAAALGAKAADEDGTWLISVPLANIQMDRAWAPAGSTAVVRRAWDLDWTPDEPRRFVANNEDVEADLAVYRHLKDRPSAPTRFFRFSDGRVEDTKITAGLGVLQGGARRVAVERAEAKAHYAVAVWWLLSPGESSELLPGLAVWSPQPDHRHQPEHRRFEPDPFATKDRRHGSTFHYDAYQLPGDDVLEAPFRAFDALSQRSAQALLSSAAALYSAESASPGRLAESILDVRRAVECLCVPADGTDHDRRWKRIARRSEAWALIENNRAYSPETVTRLQQRLKNARDIGTHGADSALIDLGWTDQDRALLGGRTALAGDLVLTALYRDLQPMMAAVAAALRHAWREMLARDFHDSAFESLFAAP
jgi:hypothetical protein